MATNQSKRPLKRVTINESDFTSPQGGGGNRKVFGKVTDKLRLSLVSKVEDSELYFQEAFERWEGIPAVAKVRLKRKALAKSHRPSQLFSSRTCPIIGVEGFGELYVSITPAGLDALKAKILQDRTKTNKANLSTIEDITPYTPEDALAFESRNFWDAIHEGYALKIRLFSHAGNNINQRISREFKAYAEALGIGNIEDITYSDAYNLLRLKHANKTSAIELAKFIGVASIDIFPRYGFVRTQIVPVSEMKPHLFPPPEPNQLYPTVGVVDSGTNPSCQYLNPWITNRYSYVASHERNTSHGGFVSALAIGPYTLNHNDKRFPQTKTKVLEVAVLGTSGTPEDELILALQEAVSENPDVKVWNLSLGAKNPWTDNRFSDLAIALDAIQETYDVLFIIAAGNYEEPPYRCWPADGSIGDADKISCPADSVRALTVGSLASGDKPTSLVKTEEPSPFSRRGPGPVYIPKPEVTHYGGNCDHSGSYAQTGILSIESHRQSALAESIGTSFATPIISNIAANIYTQLQNPSRSLVKALLIHSAITQSPPRNADEVKYYGFGIPAMVDNMFDCDPWSATLLFEGTVAPGLEFNRWPLPMPSSLVNDKGAFKGEILLTTVYDPPVDEKFGAEYCRANVEVSLGTYNKDEEGKYVHKKQVPIHPSDASKMYEAELLEHGFKWSPVKVYRRRFPKGAKGQFWRLNLSLQHRKEYLDNEPQDFVVVLTIRDLNKEAPVYDDVITRMRELGWHSTDIQVEDRIRVR